MNSSIYGAGACTIAMLDYWRVHIYLCINYICIIYIYITISIYVYDISFSNIPPYMHDISRYPWRVYIHKSILMSAAWTQEAASTSSTGAEPSLVWRRIHPSIHPSVRPSVHPSIHPSIHPFVYIIHSEHFTLHPGYSACHSKSWVD